MKFRKCYVVTSFYCGSTKNLEQYLACSGIFSSSWGLNTAIPAPSTLHSKYTPQVELAQSIGRGSSPSRDAGLRGRVMSSSWSLVRGFFRRAFDSRVPAIAIMYCIPMTCYSCGGSKWWQIRSVRNQMAANSRILQQRVFPSFSVELTRTDFNNVH